MLLYKYDKTTKEYIGCIGEAQLDPLESAKQGKDIYVIPPYSTFVAPPLLEHGFAYLFRENKEEWEKVEDHRGETGYNKDTAEVIIITELGPLPPYFTYEKPETFQSVKMQKFVDLNTAYGNAQKEEVKYGKVTGDVDLRVLIQKALDEAGKLDYVTVDLPNGETVILTKTEARNAVKYYTIRNLLLPCKKLDIAKEIRAAKNIGDIKVIEFDFDVAAESRKLMKMSIEAINEYIAERLK